MKKTIKIDSIIKKDKLYIKRLDITLENVITCANWVCTLENEENGLTTQFSGTTHFKIPEEEFIDYSQVNEETILFWLENSEEIEYFTEKYKGNIERKIDNSTTQLIKF